MCPRVPPKQAVALELEIRKAGIAMSELEYTLMLEAMSRCEAMTRLLCHTTCRLLRRASSAPASNDEAWALLRRMKDDLRLVSSDLFGAIKQWFVARCPDWMAQISTIDDDGACVADPSVRLLAVRETSKLRSSVFSR